MFNVPHLENVIDISFIYHPQWQTLIPSSGSSVCICSGRQFCYCSGLPHVKNVENDKIFFPELKNRVVTPFLDGNNMRLIDYQIRLNSVGKATEATKSELDKIWDLDPSEFELENKMVFDYESKRKMNFDSFYEIGQCLHDIDHSLLSLWVKLSWGSPNIGKCDFSKMWTDCQYHYTLDDLHYLLYIHGWATENVRFWYNPDTPRDEYVTISSCRMLEVSKFKYRCASIKYNIWYEFREDIWVQINRPIHHCLMN